MKKIFFISAANSIHTVKWVNALSNKYEVHLIYCKNHSPTIHKISNKVILHELKYKAPIGYYLNLFQLKKIYKEIKPDVINVHYASGYGTLARVSKLPNIILSVWGSDVYDFPYESKLKKYILIKNIKYSKMLASTSNVMAKQVRKIIPDLDKEITITPFGVDTEIFKCIKKNNTSDNIIIGNVKALDPKYGIDYFIKGISNLIKIREEKNENYKNIKVYIYGKGNQKEELENLIQKLNLQKIVFLKGTIPNDKVPFALNEMDIFCATSIIDSESFGVAVVEAMACALPVVATKVAGFSEVMEDKKTGLLIDLKSPEAIANALETLINSEELRKKYGQGGRKRVLEKYDWKNNVDIMIKLYEKSLKWR